MSRAGGFTLLEMIVVLALMGLATAMVAPGGYRMVASWREAADVDAAMKSLAALPLVARDQGRELRLLPDPDGSGVRIFSPGAPKEDAPQSDAHLVELPEGWTLEFDQPLVVRANGACSGGSGTLVTLRQRLPFRMEAPFCRPRPLPAGGA